MIDIERTASAIAAGAIAFGVLWAVYFLIVPVLTHRDMTRTSTNYTVNRTYKDFVKAFHRFNWSTHGWKGSLFDDENNAKIHASIIMFSGVGMVLNNPIDYYRAKRYVRAYIKRLDQSSITAPWEHNDKLGHLVIPDDGPPVYVKREDLDR
jgi:hypothetical protein